MSAEERETKHQEGGRDCMTVRSASLAREPIMQFFAYQRLPPHLQEVSKPFGELAELIHQMAYRNPERSVALRKLLEAKDAAVRAVLFRTEGEPSP